MSISRSEKARKAKSVFYQQFNDIDIYVEDTADGTSKLYSIILQRALGGTTRIETVFPLGGRDAVLRNCYKDQENGGRSRLYVIDGDLDLLTNSNPKGVKRLLVLTRYCLENYLIDAEATLAVLDEEDTQTSKTTLREKFSFADWVHQNESGLFALFVLYAISRNACPDDTTVSYPVNKLVSSNHGVVDAAKLKLRMEEIEKKITSLISRDELSRRVDELSSICRSSGNPLLSYVSGKHYLFPMIIIRMRNTTKLRADNKVIKQRLAMRCDVSELSRVATMIL